MQVLWLRLLFIALSVFFLIVPTFLVTAASAAEEPWPEPFTLEMALEQATADHPQLQIAAAELEQARAEFLQAESQTGLESRLSGRLRWVDPSDVALDQSQDDHRLSLFVNKRLYDFGRTAAQEAAGVASVAGREHYYKETQNRHRINIMAAYFDALLSDYAYARDNEDMSIAFIRADRARQRNELGQLSDIELMELRSQYQTSRVFRYTSDGQRRTTRARLANVLNRPTQLPSELTTPELPGNNRAIPEDIEGWLSEAEKLNPMLFAMQAQVTSAQQYLNAAKASDNPFLTGEMEVAQYSRESGSHDNWRAGVTLDIPLITGGRARAERAKNRAALNRTKAMLEKQRRYVRQAILETWAELNVLKIKREQAIAETDYREIYLDRSRALYEMEVKSDLGDSMTRTSAVRYESLKIDFTIALAWARIEALLGREVFSKPNNQKANIQKSEESKP
jgi:outer membrane protein TolC